MFLLDNAIICFIKHVDCCGGEEQASCGGAGSLVLGSSQEQLSQGGPG